MMIFAGIILLSIGIAGLMSFVLLIHLIRSILGAKI